MSGAVVKLHGAPRRLTQRTICSQGQRAGGGAAEELSEGQSGHRSGAGDGRRPADLELGVAPTALLSLLPDVGAGVILLAQARRGEPVDADFFSVS